MAFMGYETPVEAPQMRIYNTDLMKMYIAGVKEQYDQSREDYKDFMKSYGDFYSPIANDTERYNDATINAVSNFVSQMGPDLFRTPEGQAAITRLINSVPVGKLNQIKQSAEIAKEYVKNRGELMAKGLWNPEYEKWRLGGRSLEDWDTSNDGMWTNYSPAAFQDLHSFTDDWFKHLEPQLDEEYTAAKNDGFDYYRTSEKDLRGVISGRLDDVIKDGGLGQFYYYQALQAAGGDADLARELLTQDIVARNSDYYREKKEADPYKLDRARTANDLWLHKQKKAYDDAHGEGNGAGKGAEYSPLFEAINIDWTSKITDNGKLDPFTAQQQILNNRRSRKDLDFDWTKDIEWTNVDYAKNVISDLSVPIVVNSEQSFLGNRTKNPNGNYKMNDSDFARMITYEQAVSNMYGNMYKAKKSSVNIGKLRDDKKEPKKYEFYMHPTSINNRGTNIVVYIDKDGKTNVAVPMTIVRQDFDNQKKLTYYNVLYPISSGVNLPYLGYVPNEGESHATSSIDSEMAKPYTSGAKEKRPVQSFYNTKKQ